MPTLVDVCMFRYGLRNEDSDFGSDCPVGSLSLRYSHIHQADRLAVLDMYSHGSGSLIVLVMVVTARVYVVVPCAHHQLKGKPPTWLNNQLYSWYMKM